MLCRRRSGRDWRARIIASLDEPGDVGVDSAWVAEIQRRFEEVRDGTVELSDWSEVRRRIEAKLAQR